MNNHFTDLQWELDNDTNGFCYDDYDTGLASMFQSIHQHVRPASWESSRFVDDINNELGFTLDNSDEPGMLSDADIADIRAEQSSQD